MALLADMATADVAAIVTAIATVVLTLVTAQYVWLTHQLTKAHTDPYVIVYAQNRPSIELRAMIEIVIENIGRGVARDVRFSLSRPIPCRFLSKNNSGTMDEGPLIDGIAALGPGQKRVLLWGRFEEIIEGTHGQPVPVTITFKRLESSIGVFDDLEPVLCMLEVASLKHSELRFEDGSWECAVQLARIASSKPIL